MKRKREEQDTKKGGKESNTIRGRKRSKEKDKPRNTSKRSQRSKREEERRCSNRSQRKQQVSREVTEERKEARAAERKKGRRDAADEAKEDAGVEGVSPPPFLFPLHLSPVFVMRTQTHWWLWSVFCDFWLPYGGDPRSGPCRRTKRVRLGSLPPHHPRAPPTHLATWPRLKHRKTR